MARSRAGICSSYCLPGFETVYSLNRESMEPKAPLSPALPSTLALLLAIPQPFDFQFASPKFLPGPIDSFAVFSILDLASSWSRRSSIH